MNLFVTFVNDINNSNSYESILTAKCCQTPLRTDIYTVQMCHTTQTTQSSAYTLHKTTVTVAGNRKKQINRH